MLEVAKSSVKLELMALECALQLGKKLAAEQSAQDANRQKEPVPTTHPAFAVEAQTATGDHAMQVGMNVKVLSPGVQERHTAELCAQVLRVSAERQQCFGSGAEQHPIDNAAILKCQATELVRNGEHDVEVLHVEYLPLASLKPSSSSRSLALRTMPVATRVVDHHLVVAALTTLEMASQSGRSALGHSVEDSILLL
jgi:hypothetical protein